MVVVQPFDTEEEAVGPGQRLALRPQRDGLHREPVAAPTGSRPPSGPAPSGSTASSSATCGPRSGATRTRASAARAAATAASSSPSPRPWSCSCDGRHTGAVRQSTAAAGPGAQHGRDTSNPKKVVTMRPVRILLVAIALLAVGLTGWAFGTRGGGYSAPEVSPTATTAAPQVEPVAAPAPAPAPAPVDDAPEPPKAGGTPDDTAPPAQRPRILGFGSEPVLPTEGAFWQLPSGAGLLTMVLDAPTPRGSSSGSPRPAAASATCPARSARTPTAATAGCSTGTTRASRSWAT